MREASSPIPRVKGRKAIRRPRRRQFPTETLPGLGKSDLLPEALQVEVSVGKLLRGRYGLGPPLGFRALR